MNVYNLLQAPPGTCDAPDAPRSTLHAPITGQQILIDGEEFYQIANYDRLRPFLMSIVSSSDHWLFLSSTGALTAGRQNPDFALFPYYTDDKIHDSADVTGSKAIFIVHMPGANHVWEPFSNRYLGIYRLQRNLYKNLCGNKIIFEETNHDLGLTFRYTWFTSEHFGFIRKASLTRFDSLSLNRLPQTNGQVFLLSPSEGERAGVRGIFAHSRSPSRIAGKSKRDADLTITLLDGIQNLMPCGASSQFQLEKSTLLNAYKRSELLESTGLGLFRLSSIPIDRPEPAESLQTTTVFSLGLKGSLKLLSSLQLDDFRLGKRIKPETDIRAERGAYFVHGQVCLAPGKTIQWQIIADVARGPCDVAYLQQQLARPKELQRLIEADIQRGTQELKRMVASADGLQKTGRAVSDARHFANVLFNIMRGGVFKDGYQIEVVELKAFIRQSNRQVADKHAKFLNRLGQRIEHSRLVSLAARTKDPQLERLCHEFMPLIFSRRHGDPSRPWNRFSIAPKKADGSRLLGYEGNWRDIFQNWEALAVSFPGYVSSMICKFLNASTADGYNPYRITDKGIEWEVLDPHDPWSFIGYWCDHQIIYLLKLLEIQQRHHPLVLRQFLTREIFSYANVPYRIKPYAALVANPKDTVIFDADAQELVRQRVRSTGADGRLLWDRRGQVRLVNLAEKLLVPLLAKLSNFIPGAGIWLNTQRPEWNDANNALVGNGASMVTVYYLRRHLAFCLDLFAGLPEAKFSLSLEVADFFKALLQILSRHGSSPLFPRTMTDSRRRQIVDDLGRAGEKYREGIYKHGFSGRKVRAAGHEIIQLFKLAMALIDDSIESNCRPDGLYHAYNLVSLDRKNQVSIRRLYEMLEGQAAVLSSGCLSPQESLRVLRALKKSAMYHPDQHSYLLYPDRHLPPFIEKNNLPAGEIKRCPLLKKLLADGNNQLIERDLAGKVHFHGGITNARDLCRILHELARAGYGRLVKQGREHVLNVFEKLFDHASFTGRSGTFFGYEGLGCIYWHMVSKLLLATQETFFRAVELGSPGALLKALADCYYDIRASIGDYKSPSAYGAFPMDPYSHTPGQGGARQPGLTGQVKEDFLCRMGELGVFVKHGELHFQPSLLRREGFLTTTATFTYFDISGTERQLHLKADSLAFTYCQVPVIYHIANQDALVVTFSNQGKLRSKQLRLDANRSRQIFNRIGNVARLDVWCGSMD